MAHKRTVAVAALMCAAVLIAAVLARSWSGALAPGRGPLACDEASFSFGGIREEQLSNLTHEFVLRNGSSRPIEIERVQTSCGCASAVLASHVLAPGQSTALRVTLDWRGRTGPQQALLTVIPLQERNSPLLMSLSGIIDSPALVSPSVVDLGTLPPGLSEARTIKVVSSPSTHIDPVGVRTTDPAISVRPIANGGGSQAGEGQEYEVRVEVPRARVAVQGRVVFTLGGPHPRYLAALVIARSTGALHAQPASVLFPTATSTRVIHVTVSANVLPTDVTAEISPASARCFHIIRISRQDPRGEVTDIMVSHDHTDEFVAASLVVTAAGDRLEIPLAYVDSTTTSQGVAPQNAPETSSEDSSAE